MKQNSIKDIVKNNEERVKQFINESLTTKNGPTTEKILTNCPRCGGPFKVTINLDWSNCYCHKCSTSWTLYNFFKEIGSASSFIELLEELTNLSNYDIFSRIIVSNVHDVTSKQKESGFHKFIKDYGLFPISKLKIPYQYALSRTRNDKQEVSKYYADEKFIYIPITLDGDIKSFLCRSYINLDGSQRYKNISGSISSEYDLINIKHLMGFQDEVFSNIYSDTIYIAEGYFDSYSINAAFKDYVSICLFGKSLVNGIFEQIQNKISQHKKIVIVLDSAKKDKEIASSIIKLGKLFMKYYSNIYVSQLQSGDPNEIYTKLGKIVLKTEIRENMIPFIHFLLSYPVNYKENIDAEIANYCK